MNENIGDCGVETIQTLLDLLNPLHGDLDNQLYDERRKQSGSEMDIPRDAEFSVNITEGQERDLTQAVLILEDRKRHAQSAAALPPMRAREEIARAVWINGSSGRTLADWEFEWRASPDALEIRTAFRQADAVLALSSTAGREQKETDMSYQSVQDEETQRAGRGAAYSPTKHGTPPSYAPHTAGQEWRDISSAKKVHAHEIAMTLCAVDGHDPDTEAPLTEMCDDANMPVPWWMVYVEYAEALLDKFTILPVPPVAEPIVADKSEVKS